MVRAIASAFRYIVNILFIIAILGWIVFIFQSMEMFRYNTELLFTWGIAPLVGIFLVFGAFYVLLDISLTLHAIEHNTASPQQPAQYQPSYQQPFHQPYQQAAQPRPQITPPQQPQAPRAPYPPQQ